MKLDNDVVVSLFFAIMWGIALLFLMLLIH
jgi:hypothetical protein